MNFNGSLQVTLWRMVVVGFVFFFLASAEKEVEVMDGFHGSKRELLLLIRGRRLLMHGKAGINHPVVNAFMSSKREVPDTFDPLHNR